MKTKENYASLILRAAIGFGFMAHGWAKLSRGTAGFEKLLVQLKVPFPHLAANLVPYVELTGGLAVFVGALTVLAALPLIATMLVAMFTVHLKFGYSSVRTIGLNAGGPVFGPPGYEIDLLYIAGLVALMLYGPGLFSVDAWLRRRRPAER